MANEYLKRTPTSTGNRKKWTWSGWIKINKDFGSSDYNTVWSVAAGVSGDNSDRFHLYHYADGRWGTTGTTSFSQIFTGPGGSAAHSRDPSSWIHICLSVDTTTSSLTPDKIQRFWVNGIEYNYDDVGNIAANANLAINGPYEHFIGRRDTSTIRSFDGQMTDLFLVDGQSLTPDVFGFYKEGKGYVSAGSTQATDFRPGQWVPKAPRIIKSEIERRGGFGVNGFYLPMNSSNNFGADFHTTPDTILKLKEDLPQPKAEIDGVGDYTNALRDDPFKQYLVLAVPGVIGGRSSGYGDYSADIKGSGSNKTVTANGNAGVAVTASYYGSALSFDGNGDYLSIPDTEDFEFGTGDYTVEFWVNCQRATSGTIYYEEIVNKGYPFQIYRTNTGAIFLAVSSVASPGGYDFNVSFGTPGVGDWAHICVERVSNTTTMYLNGVAGNTSNANSSIYNSSSNFFIGDYADNAIYPFNGYIQDLRVYKGVAKYKGGFDVPKPYTPVGIATWRAVPDTTANNFMTMIPLSVKNSSGNGLNLSLSDGNLTVATDGTANQTARGSFSVSSGKWYFETTVPSATGLTTQNSGVGVVAPNIGGVDGSSGPGYAILYREAGGAFLGNGDSRSDPGAGTHATYVAGDIIGVALDIDNGDVEFFKNGVSAATYNFPTHAVSGTNWTIESLLRQSDSIVVHNFGQNPTFSGNTTAGTYTDSNGKGLFKYQPPTGFLALCEDNLPSPAISDPGEHFKTVLWTGDDQNGRSITGVGFKPDLVWIKKRNGTNDHNLFDIIRGPNLALFSSNTNGDTSYTNRLFSFDGNGFTIGSSVAINQSSRDFVAWCWKAGGPAVTNTDGTITSQVSANQDAGFSIVSYTGNSTGGATVGHGLGKTPSFIIVKNRDVATTEWLTLHTSAGKTGDTTYGNEEYFMLRLNSIDDRKNYGIDLLFPGNSSTFVVGGSGSRWVNHSGDKYIAYCWTEIEGFSKFGSYVANGNADGPFVYLGFKPAWVMIKCSTSVNSTCTNGGYNSWGIYDSSRDSSNPAGDSNMLWANRNYAEGLRGQGSADSSYFKVDLLSNGFKIRGDANCENNSNGATYIFAAFAESPFQTANSK